MLPLGRLHVDSGRFETQQWAFFASGARVVDVPRGDEELSLRFVPPSELRASILAGEFNHSAHVAMVALACFRGKLPL